MKAEIEVVDGVIQSNAAQAEETNSAAVSLAATATDLSELVGEFNLPNRPATKQNSVIKTPETTAPIAPAQAQAQAQAKKPAEK